MDHGWIICYWHWSQVTTVELLRCEQRSFRAFRKGLRGLWVNSNGSNVLVLVSRSILFSRTQKTTVFSFSCSFCSSVSSQPCFTSPCPQLSHRVKLAWPATWVFQPKPMALDHSFNFCLLFLSASGFLGRKVDNCWVKLTRLNAVSQAPMHEVSLLQPSVFLPSLFPFPRFACLVQLERVDPSS